MILIYIAILYIYIHTIFGSNLKASSQSFMASTNLFNITNTAARLPNVVARSNQLDGAIFKHLSYASKAR